VQDGVRVFVSQRRLSVPDPPRRGIARLILHTLATIGAGAGAQILAGIATARYFGPAGKGVLSYAAVLANFALAAAEGLRNGVIFEAGTQGRSLARVWRTALVLAAAFAPAGMLLFFLLWRHEPAQLAFLFVALAFPFALYVQAINGVYVVRHDIERLNTQNAWTFGAGSSVVTLVAVVFFHATLVAALGIWLAGIIASAVAAGLGARSLLARGGGATTGAPAWRAQLTFGLKGGLSASITLLALRVDLLLVSALLPPATLGIYALAVALGELPWMLSRAVTWSTTPRIGTDEFGAAAALTAKAVRFLFAFQCAAALVVAAGATLFVPLVYGAAFAGATPLLYALLPRLIAYGSDGVISYFIAVRAGHPGVQLAFETATFALCGTLAFAGIARFGVMGAALGTTLAFVLAVAAKLVYFCRLMGYGAGDVLLVRRGDVPDAIRARLPSFLRAS
jgi:O-antigen/teichoic acid export membrane protein